MSTHDFVVVRHDHDTRADVADHTLERGRHLALDVEHALGRRIAGVDPLARDAVVRGGVPRHERLPHVVVREVPVLVVRRVEVGEVELAEGARHVDRVGADRPPAAVEEIGDAQRERRCRPRRPLLHVRHLQAGGGVDAIGGFDEAREQDRLERRPRVVTCDRVADRVDACAVERLHEPRLHAERVGEVARLTRQRVELARSRRRARGGRSRNASVAM